jgi:hypothetical protein
MLIHNECSSRLNDIDELFPRRPQLLVPRQAADLLESHVISGFEDAVERGMKPLDAVAVILACVSSEMERIRLEGNAGAS